MSRILGMLRFIAAVGIVGAVAYWAFVAVRAAVIVFAAADKTIASALIAASTTAIVAVLTLVLGKVYELRIHVQKENRDKKIPVYEDLLKYFFRILNTNKDANGSILDDPEIVEFLTRFNERFIIWASDDVMRSWITWRRQMTNGALNEPDRMLLAMLLIENVMLAIRKDLGYENKHLSRGDVLALFINDIDSILTPPDPAPDTAG